MSDNGSIKVGMFGDGTGPTGKLVPKMYQSKQIWFSTKHNFFVIVDDENKPIKPFYFPQFEKFLNADVIEFTNPSVKVHMENFLSEYNAAGALFSNVDEDGIAVESDEPAFQREVPGDPLWEDTGNRAAGAGLFVDNQANLPVQEREGFDHYGNSEYDSSDPEDDYDYNEGAYEEARPKDPTRHMMAFFIVTFIIALVAFIVIRFGQGIIQSLAPFLA